MYKVKLMKTNIIMPAIKELFEEGQRVRITVTGMSMYPFLRGDKDSVELTRTVFAEVRQGDILLVLRNNQQYVLHRLIRKKNDHIYLNGDAQQWWEGPIYPEQLVAKVVTVYRQDSCIPCTNKAWRTFSFIWLVLFPFRYLIIKSYRQIHRLIQGT